jgi:hypothetical protein
MKQRYKELHLMCRAGAAPEPLYRSWISWAKRSRLEPFKRLGKTLKSHLPGTLAAYRLGASNAVAENINVMPQPYHLCRTEEIGQALDSFIYRRGTGRSGAALAVA